MPAGPILARACTRSCSRQQSGIDPVAHIQPTPAHCIQSSSRNHPPGDGLVERVDTAPSLTWRAHAVFLWRTIRPRLPGSLLSLATAKTHAVYLFFVCRYVNGFLVGANSPSFRPTMSSV